MPVQFDRLTSDQLNSIEQWIRDGAKNDAFFASDVAPIFGTAITLGRAAGQCTFCHYPGSSTGLDILAPFDTKKGLVNAPSALSSKLRVQPGSPEASFLLEKLRGPASGSGGKAMPLNYDRLSNQEVATLRAWIAQGANDD
jgi:mono/diheme cytochrome c family protein